MKAIPSPVPSAPAEAITGMSCPECFGVLNVTSEGTIGTLKFRCRVGHRYSTDDVLAGKERNLEEHLWASVTRAEELAAFLRDLVAAGHAGDRAADYEARARDCMRQRDLLLSAMQARAVTDVSVGDVPEVGAS